MRRNLFVGLLFALLISITSCQSAGEYIFVGTANKAQFIGGGTAKMGVDDARLEGAVYSSERFRLTFLVENPEAGVTLGKIVRVRCYRDVFGWVHQETCRIIEKK